MIFLAQKTVRKWYLVEYKKKKERGKKMEVDIIKLLKDVAEVLENGSLAKE